jgi:hypothetical protein
VRFSASAKSERYKRGIISVGLVAGMNECGCGVVDDVGVFGGTDIEAPPKGETGDILVEGLYECRCGEMDDVGELDDNEEPPQGETGCIGSIEGIVE